MSTVELAVLLAGLAAIAWIVWYFFFAAERSALVVPFSSVAPGAGAEATIEVDGGYRPSVIRVKAGAPVRLVFDRRDTSSCSEEVVLPEFGIRRFLPTGKRTTIEITPPTPGTYAFMCGMSMLHGQLIAE
jgi:plastocyanin domain-containing protein